MAATQQREAIEQALEAAEAVRERFEAELEVAKSALLNSVQDASRSDANRDHAVENLERARARCRQLNNSLKKALEEEEKTRAQAPTRPAHKTPALPAKAPQFDPGKRNGGMERSVPERRSEKHPQPELVRQTIGLSALVSFYLLDYFLSCQLEIMTLRSAVPAYSP